MTVDDDDTLDDDIIEMVGQSAYDEADWLIEALRRTVVELARRLGESIHDPSTDCGEALATLASLRRQLQILDGSWGHLASRAAIEVSS